MAHEIDSLTRRTRVIGVGNQKGGAGKTTNTVHIACALAELGRKVLIIDLDMNHCATRHFGVEPQAFLGAFEMLLGEEPSELIIASADAEEGVNLPANIDLIPASRKLEGIDNAIRGKSKFTTPADVLRKPLNGLRGKYDYIFLDTAPNATLPTLAAYMNADYFILSAIPDPFAIEGLNDALRDITDARGQGNPRLTLLGVVLSNIDKRTNLANALSLFVETSFKPGQNAESLRFKTTIGHSTVVPQAQEKKMTLFQTHKTHKVTNEYRELALEIEGRLRIIENPPNAVIGITDKKQNLTIGFTEILTIDSKEAVNG